MATGACGHETTNGRATGNCSTSGCWNHYDERHRGGTQPPGGGR